jgi:FkbM family methyltransferase
MKTFVEIGACDFNNLDELGQYGWQGYLVEPIPYFCEQLTQKLAEVPNMHVIQAAISDHDGTTKMLTLDTFGEDGNADIPAWMRGISHIKPAEGQAIDNFTSGLITRNAPQHALEMEVPCMTLDTLIDQNNITEIDFLQMDAEGHELTIFNNYSWKVKPKMMRIEHKFVDDTMLSQLFADQGYMCWTERDDIYAILK